MSLWVHMSAVITRHSGGACAVMRFLAANSRLIAVNLTTSGSVNGSTSRPVSEVTMLPSTGSIRSVIIIFFSPFSFYSIRVTPYFLLPGFWARAIWSWLHSDSLLFFHVLFRFFSWLALDSFSGFIEAILGLHRQFLCCLSLIELYHCREWLRIPYQPMSSYEESSSVVHSPQCKYPPTNSSIH
jgi:hypothetical protein